MHMIQMFDVKDTLKMKFNVFYGNKNPQSAKQTGSNLVYECPESLCVQASNLTPFTPLLQRPIALESKC